MGANYSKLNCGCSYVLYIVGHLYDDHKNKLSLRCSKFSPSFYEEAVMATTMIVLMAAAMFPSNCGAALVAPNS
jgi:hypothetical protein